MFTTVKSESRVQPNLMEQYSGCTLHPNQQVFAELITTDVTVQLDMPVPLYTVAGSAISISAFYSMEGPSPVQAATH